MLHRHLIAKILLLVFLATGITQAAKNKVPAAPSNLQVTAVGVNAFKLKWKDNSNNELGWDVLVSLKGGKPQHYLYIPIKDITSYTVFTNDLPGFGLVFQLAAYNGAAGKEVISDPSDAVTVRAQSPNKFETPTGLTATPVDDGRVRLQWTDNATSESGYQIQLKGPTDKKWAVLGTVQPELKFNIIASGLDPGKKYLFRVRGYKGETLISDFSNTDDVTTQPLRAPEKLEVIAEEEGSFKFKWKDTSSAETNFEFQQQVNDGEFTSLGTAPANTSSTKLIKDFTLDSDIAFRIRSIREVEVTTKVDGVDKVEKVITYSKFSKIFTTRSTPLNKPTEPNVTARTDTSITVGWSDNSARETDYQIDYRKKGTTDFTTAYAAANAETFTITGLDALTGYEFKIRTASFNFFSTLPESYSGYTSLVEEKTRNGVLPVESSSLIPGGLFTYVIELTDLTTLSDLAVSGLPPGLIFDEVTRTIRGTINRETGFSFTVTATFNDGTISTRVINVPSNGLPAMPTLLALTTSTDTDTTLSWEDNSSIDTGYQIEYREIGSVPFATKVLATNIESYTFDDLNPALNYEFRVSAKGTQAETFSLASGLIGHAVIGDLEHVITANTPFNHQIEISGVHQPASIDATRLPVGVVYNSTNRTISGAVTLSGDYLIRLQALFSNGYTSTRFIKLKQNTLSSPVVVSAFDAKNLSVGGSVLVPVTGKFSDPDTTIAERFQTTNGAFDIIFFPTETPLTVDNFIAYLNAGAYNNMFFHRSPADFVVQGGGYKHTTANGFSAVTKFQAILNEPGISNLRGTVAMAKLGGNPNSATSEWFVNVQDNSGNLDFQNDGFTAFGRVPAAGMVVVDAINNLPVRNYTITIGSSSIQLTDVPINAATAPAVLDPTKLVKVLSSGPAPILTYTVTSQNNAIATAALAGTDVTITGVATGSTNIEVKATDLDGNFVTQSIPVTVP